MLGKKLRKLENKLEIWGKNGKFTEDWGKNWKFGEKLRNFGKDLEILGKNWKSGEKMEISKQIYKI